MKRYLVGYHYPDSEVVYSWYSVEDDQEQPTDEALVMALKPEYPDFGEMTIDSVVEGDPFAEPPATE